jgi:hypothetical protein
MSTEAVVAILAALGGGGFLLQAFAAWRSWREGIRQREEAADERLVARLERRIEILEMERAHDSEYIRALIEALGQAGIKIPPRGATHST